MTSKKFSFWQFSSLAMQLPYGGVSKGLLLTSNTGQHPFMSRFTDRNPISGFENPAGNPKSKLLSRLRRKNLQVKPRFDATVRIQDYATFA